MGKQKAEWLTVAEAAKALGGCALTIRKYAKNGTLVARKFGIGGLTSPWEISRASIEAYQKANRNR
jgi:hypothetical protein